MMKTASKLYKVYIIFGDLLKNNVKTEILRNYKQICQNLTGLYEPT